MARLVPDAVWAVLTIWQEARGETPEGKLGVAEVIRNRMERKYQSDGTVVGTVLRPYQFSGWNTQDRNRLLCAALDDADPVVADCREAWLEAQNGSNLVRGAVLYLNPEVLQQLPDWVAESTRVATIGHHDFYVPA